MESNLFSNLPRKPRPSDAPPWPRKEPDITVGRLQAMQQRDRWALLTRDAKPELVQAYEGWIALNPHVIATFMSLTRDMASTGRRKYSGWVIVNKMRWDHDLKTTGDVFEIRNDFIALLVREAVSQEPALLDFFEIRSMGRTNEQPPLPSFGGQP